MGCSYQGLLVTAQADAGEQWHDSPISYGELGRLTLELPSGTRRPVPSVLLDPFGAAVWLSDTPRGESLSPSLAWFAALTARHGTPVVRQLAKDRPTHDVGHLVR